MLSCNSGFLKPCPATVVLPIGGDDSELPQSWSDPVQALYKMRLDLAAACIQPAEQVLMTASDDRPEVLTIKLGHAGLDLPGRTSAQREHHQILTGKIG